MEPTKMEPTTMESTTIEPTRMEPTKSEPTKTEPTKTEPIKMEPTTTEPTTEPTTTEPTKMEPKGYEKLALLMTSDPDLAIFRTFGALNVQNLLYYQAELLQRWEWLRKTANHDRNSEDPINRTFAENCFYLKYAEKGTTRQWRKILEIRKLLKEYSAVSRP